MDKKIEDIIMDTCGKVMPNLSMYTSMHFVFLPVREQAEQVLDIVCDIVKHDHKVDVIFSKKSPRGFLWTKENGDIEVMEMTTEYIETYLLRGYASCWKETRKEPEKDENTSIFDEIMKDGGVL